MNISRLTSTLTFCFVLVLLALVFPQVQAQSLEQGDRLRNQAVATFFDKETGYHTRLYSNAVQVIIQPYVAVQLLNESVLNASPGTEFLFTHPITNSGNEEVTYRLRVTTGSKNDFELLGTQIKVIERSSGRVIATSKSGETPALTLNHYPQQQLEAEISGRIPNDVLASESSELTIHLETDDKTIQQEKSDRIIISDGADIRIFKSANVATAAAGDTVEYMLRVINQGNIPVYPVSISTSEDTREYILVKDQLPPNTTVHEMLNHGGSTVLVHHEDDEEGLYHSWDDNQEHGRVDEIAFAIKKMEVGEVFEATFSVVLNPGASGALHNTATVHFQDNNEIKTSTSNQVTVQLKETQPIIRYYQNDEYDKEAKTTRIGNPLHIMTEAAGCNENRSIVDEVTISLRSSTTGDSELFTAIETGKNTGLFKVSPSVPTKDANIHPVVELNGTLETTHNDKIEAAIKNCGQQNFSQIAWMIISPVNRVYDSHTNQPIAGAEVSLVPTEGTNKAITNSFVFDVDQETPLPDKFVTDENGLFELPSVLEGSYIVQVAPPANYTFPSILTPDLLPGENTTDINGSYGLSYYHSDNLGPITLDIPLDKDVLQGLRIEKTASKNTVELGDFIDYTIKVKNETGASLGGIFVKDELPLGFTYVRNTTQKDGQKWDNPAGGEGPVLSFNIGSIDHDQTIEVNYRLLAGPGALKGNGINKAQAFSAPPLIRTSNVSTTKTKITPGVFSDKGYLTGLVFYDQNKNGIKETGEDGIPGVRLYLNNGTFVITDGEGKYSLYGLDPETHVLKIDPYSIPQGTGPTALTTRNARYGFTQFVTIPRGGIEKVNIALCRIGKDPLTEIEARRKASKAGLELENVTTSSLSFNQVQKNRLTNIESEGFINSVKPTQPTISLEGDSLINQPNDTLLINSEKPAITTEIDNTLEIMGITDGDTLTASQATFYIKSLKDSRIRFAVNEMEVSDDYIGFQKTWVVSQAQLFEYVGIQLNPGPNTLLAELFDAFGNKRDELKLTIFAPGSIEEITLSTSTQTLPANGTSTSTITLTPVDALGIPNHSELAVTLSSTSGTWLVQDLNPAKEGTQTFLKGPTKIDWMTSRTPETASLEVASGVITASTEIDVIPDLRPLIASGIIEGTLSFNSKGGILKQVSGTDGFYEELESFAYTSNNGELKAAARTQFYLKGKILGKYLLTMSFDSEKEDESLFRDIQPDEFYPVYGDASIKGFDAQSTSKLFVRVDAGRSYVQYGDYVTQTYDKNRQLGRYNRTQTGLKGHYQTERAEFNTYATLSASNQMIDEIPGAGVSGPYMLSREDILVNSEQITIIVRDLEQPDRILSSQPLSRFVDYTLNYFTGALLLNQPVSSVDSDLNPVFIRVAYEAETGGKSYLSAGADVKVKITSNIEAGAVAVQDFQEGNEYSMQSANIHTQLTDALEVNAEIARSVFTDTTSGNAGRFEVLHKTNRTDVKIYGLTTDSTFVNPSSPVRNDRTQLGAKGRFKINNTSLLGEYVYAQNDGFTRKREGAMAGFETRFDKIRVEAGTRFSRFEMASSNQQGNNLTARSKITTSVPGIDKAEVFGEFEQELRESDRKILGAGASYEFKNRSRLYARHEFISSLGSRYDLNNSDETSSSVIGVDAAYGERGKAYSEYRVREGMSGQEAQAALGLRNRWEIGSGVHISAGFERIRQMRSNTLSRSTALTSGIDYTGSDFWKASGRAEYRRSTTNNYYFNTVGAGYKLNSSWTLLAKNFLAITDYLNTNPTLIQNKTRIGAAYRDIESARLDALLRYEYKIEKKSARQKTGTHIASAHAAFVPAPRWRFSGVMAAKYAQDVLETYNSDILLGLLSGKTLYQLTDKWDLAVQGSILAGLSNHANDYGFGVEAGHTVARNTRVVLGYNFLGLKDKDLAGSAGANHGVFLTASFKFDEQLFQGLIPDNEQYAYYDASCLCEEEKSLEIRPFTNLPLPEATWTLPTINNRFLLTQMFARNIHFATNKSDIDSTSANILMPLIAYLAENEDVTIVIEGVTDIRGSLLYNTKLGLQRAKSTAALLQSYSINPDRIQLTTTGERVTNDDKVSYAKNREVNIYLYGATSILLVNQFNDLKEIGPSPTISNKIQP